MWEHDINGMMHKSQIPLNVGLANPKNKMVANKTALALANLATGPHCSIEANATADRLATHISFLWAVKAI